MLLLGPLAIGPGLALVLPGLALVFPTGRLPSGRWTLPVGMVAVVMAAGTLIELISPGPIAPEPRGSRNPFGIEGLPAGLAAAAYPLVAAAFVGAMALGVAAVLNRYRTGDVTLRQQLRWFIAAVLLAAVPLPISILPGVGGPQWALLAAVGLLLVPVSVGIAVMRYRLYDLDPIINRGLVYSALGLIVAAAYVILATALGRLTGGEASPTATIAVVIAALAALVARQAVQRAIDRLLYGRRGDPMAVFGSVARRLESAGTPEGLLTDVVGDLRQALKLDDVAIYAVDGKLLAGTPGSEAGTRLSLAHQGELVGELRVWTARGDVLKPGDLRLLQDDLGPQLAVAIEAVRLKRDLQHARERLVVALEDERRRLRHDLHDGLGPTLTAITLRADAATNLLARDPARARELLDELRGAAGDAIAEVRQLVHGLRPMALDELGLVGAIREQGIGVDRADMAGPHVVIDEGPRLPPLPAAVEVAAYRIATEAITNAIRHAGARHCRVRIVANTALEVEVTDDGHGWDGRLIPGVGIQSMRERAADLGGTLTIERVPGGGTSVLARLPLLAATAP